MASSGKLFVFISAALCALSFLSGPCRSQDLAQVGRRQKGDAPGNAIGISGGIQANSVFYQASQMAARRDPFNCFVSGNLNISIYGWSVPLSFSYSNQKTAFHQPFNQYGLSPTYKWITLHAGYRSMVFSNYTVNGHIFLGAGADLTPRKNLRLSGFYGRLQHAVKEDTLRQHNLPAYERNGGGMKLTVGDQSRFIDLMVFTAKDDAGSLALPPARSDVDPQENLVLGIGFGLLLKKGLTLNGELASSAFTKDTRAEKKVAQNIFDHAGDLFRPRFSSSFYHAYRSAVQYAMKNMGIGLAYERVDPGYRTLGAYYFNNNLESISITNSLTFFQHKGRAKIQVGVQRNNLDRNQLNTMSRLSASVNAGFQFSRKLMLNTGYSNFQTIINFRPGLDDLNQGSPYENPDTLNFRQIAQNSNLNVNYILSDAKDMRQHLGVNITWQRTADEQASTEQPTGANFYNFNSGYTLQVTESQVTLNLAGNANLTTSDKTQMLVLGPNMSIRKTYFGRKVGTGASLSYNSTFQNHDRTGRVVNLRVSGNYTLREKHQLNMNLTQSIRSSMGSGPPTRTSELTIQFGYSYNFSLN